MDTNHLTAVVVIEPPAEDQEESDRLCNHLDNGYRPDQFDNSKHRPRTSSSPPFFNSTESGLNPGSISRSQSPADKFPPCNGRILKRMSPSRKLSTTPSLVGGGNSDDGHLSSVAVIPIDPIHPHVTFLRTSRLSVTPPLLAGRQSYSAPPSPTAGSKATNQSSYTFNNTLTNIDKLRKWMSSRYVGRGRKRVIFKNGDVNTSQTHVSQRRRRYLKDLFTTLVDLRWRLTLFIFSMSFMLSWLLFAVIWWGIGRIHGDLDPENVVKMNLKPPQFTPCISNFHGFPSAFLFSVETQHTIGYGYRYTTEECPFAVLMMCVQSIVGVLIQAVMVGIIFAKLSRPKKRMQTLVFSRNAVICQRDGQLCLIFRVGDVRKSHIISANIRAQVIRQKVTREGEVLPYYHHELKVGVDDEASEIFFIWPVMVVHKIDDDSPLYGMSEQDLKHEQFEIVVILEGVSETSGATTQARSSYLPSEILWGHRFESMISFKKDIGEYTVDHTAFNHTYEFDTPICSAKELDALKEMESQMRKQGSISLLAPFHRPSIISTSQYGQL